MMMLIFSIIVMCSYLYLVCLLYRVLKKTYLKQHLSVVASTMKLLSFMLPHIAYLLRKTILKLNFVQFLNIVPMKKTQFMVPMEYNTNGKGIMAPMKYILIILAPIENAWLYEGLFLKLEMVMVKEKKNTA